MTATPRIVLTGFGPFPGTADNATAALVPRLGKAARALFPDYAIDAEVLPTEWRGAPDRLHRLAATGDVALMLHFGVAEAAHGFRLERVGRNVRGARLDAAGELPGGTCVIGENAAHVLVSTLPLERISARLDSLGLPCGISEDAGDYLCNALLYHSLAAARGLAKPYLAGFVHVPAALVGHGPDGGDCHPDCPLDWKMAVVGGLEIIAACLEHLAEREAPLSVG